MDGRSRSLANSGIGVGFLAAALAIAVFDDGGVSLVVGFGSVGGVVLLLGLIQLARSRRAESAGNGPS